MQLDLELYREEVLIDARTKISYIDVAPDHPQRTMVLVHGFGGSARQWRYQIEEFSRLNRVIAIDNRGHGRSTRRAEGCEMGRLLQDVTAVLEHAGVKLPCVLIGHSFGVAIATEYAVAHPERVSHLILVAGAGEYQIAWYYRLAFRLPASILHLLQPLFRGYVDASLPSLKQWYLRIMSRWKGWDRFPSLKPPTLVILGNRDRVLPQSAFERVAELVPPESEVVNVGVSAHMVMLERRDAVNRTIERFIEQDKEPNRHLRWRSDSGNGAGRLLAERPWIAHYESGVPPTIHVPRLPLTRLLDRARRRFPGRPAVQFMGRTLTYRKLSNQVGRFANGLAGLGIVKGQRIMVLLPNVPQLVIAYLGTLRLGCVVVMGNPLAKPEELVRQARNSGAAVLVALAAFRETAESIKAQSGVRHIIYARASDYLPFSARLLVQSRRKEPSLLALQRSLPETDRAWPALLRGQTSIPPQVEINAEDTAVIQFTSGTTDRPKGITLTHYNLVANGMQTRAWIPSAQDGREVILSVVPFSHVYGMTAGMNVAVGMGASMVLLPSFDVETVLRTIKKYRPTLFPGVPTMYVAINNHPGVRRYDVESIRACISGAAPLPIEVKESFEKLTRGKLVEGYGLSEASPVTHANPMNGRNKAGSIGVPLPNTEARIVDLNTGVPLPPGQLGELTIRGPQVMGGYWQDPEASAAVIDKDGWLHTNDVARMDEDGYFQIISRRQDMWQDENEAPAFPRDVEEVIYELPEVREVVVVAIANRPIAFVCLAGKNRIPTRTILEFCRRRLPPNHVPRLVIFVKDFPRNFVGKVLRRELVSQYATQIRAEAGSVADYLEGLSD